MAIITDYHCCLKLNKINQHQRWPTLGNDKLVGFETVNKTSTQMDVAPWCCKYMEGWMGWDGMDHRVGWDIEHKYGANKWSFIYYVIHFVPNKDLTTINDRHSAVNWVANDILQFYSETQMNHWSARKLPCWQQWYLGSSVDSDQHISVLYFFVNKKSNYQWQRSLARFWHVALVALSCSDTVDQ